MSEQKFNQYPIGEVSSGDDKFPQNLLKETHTPKKLYYRGEISLAESKSIAIVGSRRMTRYGAEVVTRFVSAFCLKGITTVSGFMYGVDTEVHKKTVEYGGKTIAVFGSGLDVCYPAENDKLYGEIVEGGGLVLSEYEREAKPHLWKFPQRNRIVAGLSSLGVLVIEAGEGSGSIVTAKLAHRMGKTLYAVPGPVTSNVSRGTNALIKEGIAKLVAGPEDILGELDIKYKGSIGAVGLEKNILDLLGDEAFNADEIAVALEKSIVELSSTLSIMSMKGMISESGGKYYLVKS